MFIAALFSVAHTWKQLKCPTTEEWIKKLCVYTMEYCLGNGNPFQHFFLENSMDRGARQATIHEVTKNWTSLSN